MYRQFLLVDGTVQRVLACTSLLAGDPVTFSLVIKLCVNMDVLKERKVKGAPKHKDASSRRVAALEGGYGQPFGICAYMAMLVCTCDLWLIHHPLSALASSTS